MPINRLPDATRRLLSSMSIPSPTSLVKELLDNSIDAQATSIEILISQNTIDKIEVRDNGFGIHPDDFDCLGRSGYTSKLTCFEELEMASSKTLGFRGEALSSARKLARITVTTRRSTDQTGTQLEIDSERGGVLSRKVASTPVGTTLSATKLFGKLEVRAKYAAKEASKTLGHIKELLTSYAMARPSLRLTLKVIGSPGSNWSYSPKSDAQAKEAILQLFGADCLAGCCEKVTTATTDGNSGDHYAFEAHLLSPGSPPTKSPRHRYLSVDGRPVAIRKGTPKKLVTIYKKHITLLFERLSLSGASPGDQFLRLDIRCPAGSYDANIEPSKDDVIFVDEQFVLDQFEALCKAMYSDTLPKVNEGTDMPDSPRRISVHKAIAPPESSEESCLLLGGHQQWKFNMSDDFNETSHDYPIRENLTSCLRPLTPFSTAASAQSFEQELPILRPRETGPRDLDETIGLSVARLHHPPVDQAYLKSVQLTSTSPKDCMPKPSKTSSLARRRRPLPPWTPPSSVERPAGQRQERIPPDGLAQTTIAFGTNGRPEVRNMAFAPIRTSTATISDAPKETSAEEEAPAETSLDTDDPRAYLLRRQKSIARRPHKIRRLKSCLMPLEITPAEDQLYDLSYVTTIDLKNLTIIMNNVKAFDRYIIDGANAEGLDINLAEGRTIQEKLQKLIPDETVNMNLVGLLKGKGAAAS